MNIKETQIEQITTLLKKIDSSQFELLALKPFHG